MISYNYAVTNCPSGMIMSKTTTLDGVNSPLKYAYRSTADTLRNHQIQIITSGNDTTKLTWDVDGQLSTMQRVNQEGEPRNTRRHVWNENGQMAMFMDDKAAGYYGYDGNGERAYKLTGYVHRDGYNAGEETTRVMLNDVVLYANPYFIVTPKGYTKHYYNGSNRLATKVFSGVSQWLADSSEQAESNQAKEYIGEICKKDSVGDSKLSLQCETNMLAKSLTNDIAASGTYYYHGDHLGSCSWITDVEGSPVEYISYLPYGEEWYHKRFDVSNYVERYTFTGKEKDEESGYYYFGARYFEAMLLTSFMSVDPLAGTYPYLTPYHYGACNPLRYVDPNGMWVEVSQNEDGTYRVDNGVANRDRNIYITKDGQRTGDVLGKSATRYSFFDGENNVVKGATIDMNDHSGEVFLDDFAENTPSLWNYVTKEGKNGGKYDFKSRGEDQLDLSNMTDKQKSAALDKYRYRGMPLKQFGKNTIGTARDVGNYAAGFLGGKKAMPYNWMRWGFDKYNGKPEPPVSRSAQDFGYSQGWQALKTKVQGWFNWLK